SGTPAGSLLEREHQQFVAIKESESIRVGATEQAIHLVPTKERASPQEPTEESNQAVVGASDIARKMAEAAGLDLTTIQPSNGTRITKADVDRALGKHRVTESYPAKSARPRAPDVTIVGSGQSPVRLSPMRRITASRLTLAKQTIPHFYLHTDCRVDALI